MEWFKITEEGEIEFVTEEVKLVPEVKAILTREYNTETGDAQGRKRNRAKRELKFLILNYSPKSPYRDYSENERIEEAIIDCKLPKDFKPSDELLALVPKFLEGRKSRAERSLTSANKFLDKLEAHLEKVNLDERSASGGVVHDPQKIMKTLENIPLFAMKIEEYERQIRQGITASPTSKGDHELGWMAMNGMPDPKRPKVQYEEAEDQQED